MTGGEPETLEAWLARAGLDWLEPVFRANGIDLDVVGRLTEADLRELGLTLGDRKRVLAAAEVFQTGSTTVDGGVSHTSLGRRSDAEHRQLTVLFCDLVGSTALARRLEPEDLNRLLGDFRNACTVAVTRFEGVIAKFLGDGVLAYFGFPAAHEDDPERAVRAGLAMVEAIVGVPTRSGEPIAARVGIATGLVVVGHVVESGLAREHDASGETLNLAARLQDVAGPNSVVVAETTRRLLGDLFEDIELGPQHLKGFDQPEPAWQIVRSRAPGSRFLRRGGQQLTTFVGRDSEVGLLAERWQQACEGDGQVVLLSGEAGIGKSRLVERLHQQIGSVPHRRIDFQCSPHYTGSALFPAIVRLEQEAGFAPEDFSAEKLDKLEAVLAANPEGQTGETAALMAALLSIEAGGRYPPLAVTPERQRQLTLDSLVRQVAGFAHRDPLLLVFEDVHWSDATTLEWLGRIFDIAARARIMVLITCRPEFVPAWPSSGHISALQLNRLSRRHVAEIVDAQSAGKALPAEVREQILTRADGVPLFVEELTRTVLQSDLLREEADGYSLTHPLRVLAIPATLEDSSTARLDRLGPAKEIAQIGAALGREFTHALVEAVAVEQRAVLEDGLQRLMEAGLLVRTRGAPDTAYMFKHALVRDAAYAGLLKSRRQRIHAEIVRALEAHSPDRAAVAPELLAYHYGEAGETERAVPYWQQAGQQALRRSANLEAVQHLRKGLEGLKMLPDTPARAQHELLLQSTLGPALMATKGYGAPEVEAVYNRALALCRNVGETPQLFGTLMGLWQFYLVRAQHQTARELAERLLSLAESTSDPALLIQAHRALGETFQNLGELILAQEHLAQGSALNETVQRRSNVILNDPGAFCLSFEFWVLWLLGYPERALERSQAALTLARRLSHPHDQAAHGFFAAVLHQFRREFHLTQQQAEAVIVLAHEPPVWVPYANIVRGWALAMQGQWEEGIAQIQRGLVAHQDLETAVARPVFLAMLSEAHAAAGQIETGLGVLAEALAHVEHTGERYYEAELYRLKGELLLRQAVTDARQAEACFQQALAVAQRQQATSWELRTATSLSRLWQQQGKRAEAYKMLAPIYGRFTEGFETADLQVAKALLERLI